MSISLDQIVPWGRSRREYELMFGFTAADYPRRILGCGDGPASFNAEMTAAGWSVVSVDPIYQFSGAQITQRFRACAPLLISQVRQHPENYVWTYHRDPETLLQNRRAALERFSIDYADGRTRGRYIAAALPRLPFAERVFELALCSHLLFLYSELLSFDFHRAAVLEMLRVAEEVRIFPLLALDGKPSKHLGPLKESLLRECCVQIESVGYELQRNGNEMMRITRLCAAS